MRREERAAKLRGADGFEKYYSLKFGARWEALRAALMAESAPSRFDAGGGEPYFLDDASVQTALSLPLEGALSILDLCAAPGGKTLVLARRMDAGARLLANDVSARRAERLRRTLDACLPPDVRARVDVSCADGAMMRRPLGERFDRALLDAPCSCERRVIKSARHLSLWSPARVKSLAVRQWSLLSSAWRMLSVGGSLLYATCALCEEENDGVVARLLKKFRGALVAKDFPGARIPFAEETALGFQILPDAARGAGPMYFCLARKTGDD